MLLNTWVDIVHAFAAQCRFGPPKFFEIHLKIHPTAPKILEKWNFARIWALWSAIVRKNFAAYGLILVKIWGQIFKLPPSSQNPIISPILTYCVRTTMPQNLTTSGYAM